jgi:uncharacterized protein YggE
MESIKTTSPRTLLVYVLILILLVIYLTNPLTVTVTGTGEASVPASNATISFTLSGTDSSSPQNAISSANAKALAMRTYLNAKGVTDGNIAQSEVSAVPASLVGQGTTGYQATISMAAKTSQVGDISTLVSGLYQQGALVVSQPVLSVENQGSVDAEAFNAAMKDAKMQAGKIGLNNWKFVRKAVEISQTSSSPTSTSSVKGDTPELIAAGSGVFKIVKAVTVTYRMW